MPNAHCLAFVLERVCTAASLIDATRKRHASAYSLLSRTASTGAFISLMLVLCGVVARLDMLLVELRDALRVVWEATSAVFTALNTLPSISREHTPSPFPAAPTQLLIGTNETTVISPSDVVDVGEKVHHDNPHRQLEPAVEKAEVAQLFEEPAVDLIGVIAEDTPRDLSSAGATGTITGHHATGSTTKLLKPEARAKKKKRAAKPVVDEIDAIFG
jgi:hypothetical protein